MNGAELSGRALDAEIARRVFGYEVESRTNARTGEIDFVQQAPSGRDWVRVAFYASSGAAINVGVELQKRREVVAVCFQPCSVPGRLLRRSDSCRDAVRLRRALGRPPYARKDLP